jgi:hypothetical protein
LYFVWVFSNSPYTVTRKLSRIAFFRAPLQAFANLIPAFILIAIEIERYAGHLSVTT